MKVRILLTITLMLVSVVLVTPIHAVSQTRTDGSTQRRRVNNLLSEEFSFLLKDYKVDHQGKNTVNINVRYRYKRNITLSEYPDFRWLAKDVDNFLTNYPNETDYWEIVNKKITQLLLDKYAALVSVTCEIVVSPTDDVPYLRTSTTTRVRSGR